MQMVRFVKPWRGHALEAVAEITDERAAELTRQKFCVAYEVPAEPTAPVAPVEQRVEVVEPESVEPETVEPEPDKPPRRRRRASN